MKLVLTVLARDEADIIGAALDYHLAHGVDAVIATDNGSVDGTRDILAAYARRGVLQLIDEPPGDFSQHVWVTRMAHVAHREHRADWVIHADADELFVPIRHATLKEALGGVPAGTSVLEVERHDFVALDLPGRLAPPAEMVFRKTRSLNLRGDPLPPKVLHRGVGQCVIGPGNHAVEGPELGAPVPFPDVVVYHYPKRDYGQFVRKVISSGIGYALNRELSPEVGFHKRHWYDLWRLGELEAVYRTEFHFDSRRLALEVESGDLVLDTTASRFFVSAPPAAPPEVPAPRRSVLPARLRVLYLLENYPQLSQTCIKTELRALGDRYDVRIIATATPNHPDSEGRPFVHLPDEAAIVAEARRFRPDVIHGHCLVHAGVLRRVAEALETPFTIRAHSFDVFAPEGAPLPAHLAELGAHLNDGLCVGVVALPFARPLLADRAGVRPEKILTAPPVVDFDHFYDRSPNIGGVVNVGACRPGKAMGDFLAVASRVRDLDFDLYAIGHDVDELAVLNAAQGGPVRLQEPVPFAAMPGVYKRHRWMLYTASFEDRTVGWPMAIGEAQASGVVTCMARIRPDLEEYVAGAGFLYDTLEEAEDILRRDPPESVRQLGFARAHELDIRRHIHRLTDLWGAD